MIHKCCLLVLFLCCTFLFVHGAGGDGQHSNVIVRASNMTESMKQDAIRITKQAFVKFNGYSTKSRAALTQHIRSQFDQLHHPSWQCIVGKDFALSITSENSKRILLDLGKVSVLIFKGKC